MDELVENLIENESVFDIVLPKIIKRNVLEENGQLKERKSVLENEINFGKFKDKEDDKSDKNDKKESIEEEEEDEDIFENLEIPKGYFEKRKRSEENNNLSEINKIKKKFKKNDDEIIKNNKIIEGNEEKNVKNDDLKNLDPNSDEYWLALRKKLGLK